MLCDIIISVAKESTQNICLPTLLVTEHTRVDNHFSLSSCLWMGGATRVKYFQHVHSCLYPWTVHCTIFLSYFVNVCQWHTSWFVQNACCMLINIFKQQVCAFWRQVYCIVSIVCIAATVRDGVAIGNKGQAGSPCCQRTHARNTDFGLFSVTRRSKWCASVSQWALALTWLMWLWWVRIPT